ncbi:unnamed protein product [Orchesella dallaii]|uniref:Uncharacterized protein n=1 Tax=Orchesella dallaii TaxID=48710 RepID=A0ABP1RIS6_9HEXA
MGEGEGDSYKTAEGNSSPVVVTNQPGRGDSLGDPLKQVQSSEVYLDPLFVDKPEMGETKAEEQIVNRPRPPETLPVYNNMWFCCYCQDCGCGGADGDLCQGCCDSCCGDAGGVSQSCCDCGQCDLGGCDCTGCDCLGGCYSTASSR